MVTGIRLQVRAISVFGSLIKVIIFRDKLHELLLNVGKLGIRELVFVWSDFLLLKITKESKFVLVDE